MGGFLTTDLSDAPNTLRIQFATPISKSELRAPPSLRRRAQPVPRVARRRAREQSVSGASDQFQPNNYLGFANLVIDKLRLDFVIDFNLWSAFVDANPTSLGAPYEASERVFAQGRFRDRGAPETTNLSNGLEFALVP